MKNPFRKIEVLDAEKLIDMAFSLASERAKRVRFWRGEGEMWRRKEMERINTVCNAVAKALSRILNSYPSLRDVPEVYSDLLEIYTSKERLKKYLSLVSWTRRKILEFRRTYAKRVKQAKTAGEARNLRREFYGRVCSLMKRIGKKSPLGKETAKELKSLPDFKQVFTVVLAGLPNVGKSSLLWRLTGSKPEIKNYPFTTKGIMLGYLEEGGKEVQIADTPGLLDRAGERRNRMEKKAIIALEKLANAVIFVFDVSGGMAIDEQENLLTEVKRLISKPLIVVGNKIDAASEEIASYVREKYSPLFTSCKTGEGIEALKKKILELAG